MKVVVAADKFKGSLSSKEVADYIEIGLKKVDSNIEVIKVPMADGGEGTVQSLVRSCSGSIVNVKVKDPLMREIDSYYGVIDDGKTAVIEMALSSGLTLLNNKERNPMQTSTYGFGELIMHALDRGCSSIIIGIGGSATNDGGAGMLQALGVRLTDKNGKDIGFGAQNLKNLVEIDISHMDNRIYKTKFLVACDVANPLCGKDGASYVYGYQKGADDVMVEILDGYLMKFGKLVEKVTGKEIIDYPGSGAAGGVGAALKAFLGAELKKGIDLMAEITGLAEKVKTADLVITGEGMLDFQTKFGKTPYGVAQIAKKYNKPVIAIAGSLGEGYDVLYQNGFDSIFSIVDRPMTLEQAMSDVKRLVDMTAEKVMRAVLIDCKR